MPDGVVVAEAGLPAEASPWPLARRGFFLDLFLAIVLSSTSASPSEVYSSFVGSVLKWLIKCAV